MPAKNSGIQENTRSACNISDEELDRIIAKRKKDSYEQIKRATLKTFGDVPMLLMILLVCLMAGSFSSIYIGSQLDVMIEAGDPMPWFFISKDFIVGAFASVSTIMALMLCAIGLALYNTSLRITDEDKRKEKHGHARNRKY